MSNAHASATERAPKITIKGLDIMVTVFIVALAFAVFYGIHQRSQRAVIDANIQLNQANEAMRRFKATRDDRILDLARDLSFAASGLVGYAEIALQSTTDLRDIKALSETVDRAQELSTIVNELLALKNLSGGVPATPSTE